MNHVVVMADDPVFRWLDRVILDLRFDAIAFQRDRAPGRRGAGAADRCSCALVAAAASSTTPRSTIESFR